MRSTGVGMISDKRIVALFSTHRSPDEVAREPVNHPVMIAGAGSVSKSFTLDLASRG